MEQQPKLKCGQRKREIRRREAARKEIEQKNEFKRIHREEKWKLEGQKPKDKKIKTIGQDTLEIIKETREKWGMNSYEKEKQELEELFFLAVQLLG